MAPWGRRNALEDEPRQERALLLACRRGDEAAYAQLVGRYQDIALRTAFLITNHRQAAEDVAQNAFINAFRHLRSFDLERSFKPWFLAILTNEARMYLRGQRRRPAVPLVDGLADAGAAAQADELLARLVRNDERAHVRAALAALDEPLRTTAVLYYFNDLSIDEIAEATGASPGAVKSRLHSARQRLRQTLAPQLSDLPVPATDALSQPRWRA
jgi:RNA polymerase sigma-70 factor (ECF subfamily)